jgi:hypothetical protein
MALANPTANTLTTKNAFIQPVLDAASTTWKNALPASSSLNDSRPPASRLASQVWVMSVGQVSAVAAPDLVVVDDRPPSLRSEFGDVAHVVVGHSRAAVQDE